MTTAAFFLVLASAVAHATWNLLLKRSDHKTAFLWSFTAVSFVVFLVPAALFAYFDGITLRGAIYGLVSAGIHGGYGLALSRSYELGDLSAAYPVARGTGVALIPILAVSILGEDVSVAAGVGIAIVVAGIYVIQTEARSLSDLLRPVRALSQPANRAPLLTGGLIAAYSLWDKAALDHIEPIILNQFNLIGYLIIMAPLALRSRHDGLDEEWRQRGPSIVAAGVLAPVAYVMVLFALTTSQVSYIGPSREIGIVLGAILGIFFLGEGLGTSRIGGAVLILGGVLTLGIAA